MLQALWDIGDWLIYNVFKPLFGHYWCEILFLILSAIFILVFVLMVTFISKYIKLKQTYEICAFDRARLSTSDSAMRKVLKEQTEELEDLKVSKEQALMTINSLETTKSKNEKEITSLKNQNLKLQKTHKSEMDELKQIIKDLEEKLTIKTPQPEKPSLDTPPVKSRGRKKKTESK